MAEDEEAIKSPQFKDRKGGLVFFGIIHLLLGGLCVLMTLVMILGVIVSTSVENATSSPMEFWMMTPAILFYVLLAVWFIWMGVGSIKARRWARALVLISSWFWLISGVTGIIFMLVFMPDMYAKMGESGQVPQNVVSAMKIVMSSIMVVFLFVIPGVFVLFYGSKNVKATCEFRDSNIRWTDKCPLPVLGLTLLLSYSALFAFWGSFGCYKGIPFFGIIISGNLGTVMYLSISILLGFLARGVYHLKLKSFWGSVALFLLGGISTFVTSYNVNIFEFYKCMDISPQSMELMKTLDLPSNFHMALYSGLWFAVIVGYILYTKKYFTDLPAQNMLTGEIDQ